MIKGKVASLHHSPPCNIQPDLSCSGRPVGFTMSLAERGLYIHYTLYSDWL
jgi:hypothetical protein